MQRAWAHQGQGRGPRRVRGLSVTEAPTQRAPSFSTLHAGPRLPLPSPQPRTRWTYSMGNQSLHRCFTVSMSSWQRRRRLTSLRALDGTTSVIHTCGGGASGGQRTPTSLGPSSSGNLQGWQDGKARTGPMRGGLLPSGAFPHQASQTPPPWREGLGGWRHPEAPSLLTRDAPEPFGGQLASGLCSLPSQPH